LVTRRRLRGCGLQVQGAAEQYLVMKTTKRSNIREEALQQTTFPREKKEHRDSHLLDFRSALLVYSRRSCTTPTAPPGGTLVLNPTSFKKNKLRVQLPILTLLETPKFHQETSSTLFHHKSPNIRHRENQL